jgi:demethylmenaquinone methyltransferase/2-methoxy-6-polyprenyl-1,4-benzoquinol methylase
MPEFSHTGEEKKKFVQSMFDEISPRYDFLNHLLSFGLDIVWRRRLVKLLPRDLPGPILDVAAGTGDVGLHIMKSKPDAVVVSIDYAFQMTRINKEKAAAKEYPGIIVLQGDGENLPFQEGSFSALTIAFGFRNIGHYQVAIDEFHRVLKPGGRLLLLEFSESRLWLIRKIYGWYFRKILPVIATLFSKSYAYRYLPESVEHFPTRGKIREMLSETNFKNIEIMNITFGTVILVSAEKQV